MANIDLNRTSQIAFLKLTNEEKERFASSISKEISAIKKVGDLGNVAPTTKISKDVKYRADKVVSPSDREDLLRNAKGNSNGAFTVPKIVE